MILSVLQPSAALAQHVRLFWLLEEGAPADGANTVIPDGTMQLMVHWGAPFLEATGERQHRVHLCGARTGPAQVRLAGRAGMMAAVFHPWGFGPLIRDDASALLDRGFAGDAVLGGDAGELAERLSEAPGNAARQAIFERFLLARLDRTARAEGQLRFVRACAGELQPGAGPASPAAIARRLGVSERTLQRRFAEATGLRPALYRRIARLQTAIRLHGATRPSLAALACDAGYADQAHMTRDFVALTGLTPRSLLAGACEPRAHE